MPPPGPTTTPSAGRRALTIGLVLTVSMAAFEALAVATILPQTVRDIGGLPYYGWVFTGFMLANLVGIPLSGRAADRRGPAAPFLAGLLLFCGGLSVAGSAHAMGVLVAGRLLQGAGAAALSTVAYVAVARAYPQEEQPRMMALLSSAWALPGLCGPAIGAGIAQALGWRAVFLGLAPVSFTAGALALAGLRGLGPPPPRPQDVTPETITTPARDAVLLAGGVALVLLGARWAGPAGAAAFLIGIGPALYALLRLLPPGTLRARAGLPAAIAVLALLELGFFTVEAFLPLALTEVRRAGTGLVAASLTAGTLAWTSGSWLQARAAGRLSRRSLLRGGLSTMIAGLLGASAVLSPRLPPGFAVFAWAVAGFGIGIAYQTATLAIIAAAPAGREGEVTATMQIANSLAVALGTGLGGELLAHVSLSAGGRPGPGGLGIALLDAAGIGACALALLLAGRVAERAPPLQDKARM